MIYRATVPIHGGSSVEPGLEPGALRPQSGDLATRPPRPPLFVLIERAAKNELSPPGLIIQGDVIIYHHYINAETDGEVLIVNTDHSSIPPAGDMSRHQSSNSPLVTSPWVMATHP
ncbi:hypothetical protein AVEN_71623-2, partial [Araneus ventricosus]